MDNAKNLVSHIFCILWRANEINEECEQDHETQRLTHVEALKKSKLHFLAIAFHKIKRFIKLI